MKAAARDDFAVRKARANKKAGGPKQKFVHFGPVTEIDQQKWDRLSIGRASRRGEAEEASSKDSVEIPSGVESSPSAAGRLRSDAASKPQNEPRYWCGVGSTAELEASPGFTRGRSAWGWTVAHTSELLTRTALLRSHLTLPQSLNVFRLVQNNAVRMLSDSLPQRFWLSVKPLVSQNLSYL